MTDPARKAAQQAEAQRQFTDALAKANAWFEALTPEQQKDHREEQRQSWVIGEMMLSHPEMTRAEAMERYERAAR